MGFIEMEEFKGTPGPWVNIGGAICAKLEGVCSMMGSVSRPIPKANAALIAAAPDLLEALQRTLYQPLTGNPSYEGLVEFWEYEKEQGRGEADDMLFALATIEKALGR